MKDTDLASVHWRKSTHSGGNSGQCVEVADLASAPWRKSTRSGGVSGQCVEVADLSDTIGIRDSKNPHHPALTINTRTFEQLLQKIKTS